VREEYGHYFLRALTLLALVAAITEGNLTIRPRGVTPDITIRFDPSSDQKIYEVKVIGYCKAWYPAQTASSSAAYGVEKRAQSVPGVYARKLRAHDVKFGMRASATDGGPPGPLEAGLATANLQVLSAARLARATRASTRSCASWRPAARHGCRPSWASTQARRRHASGASPTSASASRSRAATRSSSSRASAASTCAARTAMERTWATRCLSQRNVI
jgi:hypothetical protein